MSSGNAIVDALDGLSAEVAKCTAAVKSASPAALAEAVKTAASTAAGEVRQALAGNRDTAADLRAATEQAQQAAAAAIEAGNVLAGMGWKVRTLLVLLLVLAGVCVGVVFGVRLFPSTLMATAPGCKIAGGQYSPAQQNRPFGVCWFQ